MMKILNSGLLFVLSLLVAACASSQKVQNDEMALNLIMCKEPRPEICTLEYDPVCAGLKNGATKTASTGCTACADHAIVAYTMGACKAAAAE